MTEDNRHNPIAEFQRIRLAVDKGRGGENLPAAHGNFSEGFFRRVSTALKMAGDVVEHVLAQVIASGGAGERIDGTKEAPLPMSVQAFNDANELYSLLVYWTRVFATELKVQAPGPAVRAWRNQRGHIVGLPADTTPSNARYMVGIMTTWLTVHLEKIMALDPEDVVMFESGESGVKTVFAVNARWPQRDRARYSDMPCPDTEQKGCKGKIAIYPPKQFDEDERILCESCGRHFPPDQYEALLAVYRGVKADEQSAENVMQHLLKKYAR